MGTDLTDLSDTICLPVEVLYTKGHEALLLTP